MAAVVVGTGLGGVYLTSENGQYKSFASEGGMTEFHAHDEKEWKLR
jgi:glucokinase